MRIAILFNDDFKHLPAGVSRNSQDAVLGAVAAFEKALRARGASVTCYPLGEDAFAFDPAFAADDPDLVVNLCESFAGDARGEMIVPAFLDLLGTPYTGSGPLALALALHKPKAKELLRARGVATPEWAVVRGREDLDSVDILFPAIVKPAHEDASIGIDHRSVVIDRAELAWACERVLMERAQPALVERFIDGHELNVALLGARPQVLPIHEIDFTGLEPGHPRIVTYAAKWDESAPEYHATLPVPCRLPREVLEHAGAVARGAFEALELRDYGRVDIRVAPDGTPYVIEVNPNCDLSPDAGFAKAARAAGLDHEALVWRLVEVARSRHARPTAGAPGSGASRADAPRHHGILAGRGDLCDRARAARPR